MKRMLIATGLAAAASVALPATANAGVGFTAHQSWEGGTRALTSSRTNVYPSLDIVTGGNVIQIEALQLVHGITVDQLWLGGTFYTTVQKGKIKEDFNGVVQAGAGLDVMSGPDYAFDAVDLQLTGEIRMGAQKAKDIGIGLYVVPKVGFGYNAGAEELELVLGGGVQISTWINN